MSDIVERLRDPEWRGPMQHLRSWSSLDALHEEAAAEIARLRAELAAEKNAVATVGADIQDAYERMLPELHSLRAEIAEACMTLGSDDGEGDLRAMALSAVGLCNRYSAERDSLRAEVEALRGEDTLASICARVEALRQRMGDERIKELVTMFGVWRRAQDEGALGLGERGG